VYPYGKNNHIAGTFFIWTLCKYTLREANNPSKWYIYIPIARGKCHLQHQVIRFQVNCTDMLIKEFNIDAA
jgi:hypothetical protein